jgi:putative addiction module component (TIGR02574 family)
MRNLPQDIDALSAAEKLELIDMLWESIETEIPALTEEQRTELDDRVARYAQNPSDVIPWEQIRTELFNKQ